MTERTEKRYSKKATDLVWNAFHQTFKEADVKKFVFKTMGPHYFVRLFNSGCTDIHADVVFGFRTKKVSVILSENGIESRKDLNF